MEIAIAIVVVLALAGIFQKGKIWQPLRGAPDVAAVDAVNKIVGARIEKLIEAGRHDDALAVHFGSLVVPLEDLRKPTAILGLPGCGKSSLINMILASLVKLFGLRTGRTRFVILDVKNELPRRLDAMVPKSVPIEHLNPLHAHAAVLDFPSIFDRMADIDQLAHTICPPIQGDQNPFFRNAARQAIAQVAKVLQNHQAGATKPWGLYDLCAILVHKPTLRRVMKCDFEAWSFYRTSLANNIKSAADVLSSIRSVIQPLIPAALAELDNPRRFNLKSFLRSDGIAVLGIPPTGSQAVLPLLNVFIRRLIEEAQTNQHPDDRLVLILDEIALLDRAVIQSIITATCVGRSSGIYCIFASQSLELLEAQFGKDASEAILSTCPTKVGFRCGSRRTAEFFAGAMGSQEGFVYLTSWSSGRNGSNTTTSQQLQIRATVLPDELLHLPLADPVEDAMHFYAVGPTIGNAKVSCTFVRETTVETDPSIPNYLPRSDGERGLKPLSKADFKALGILHAGRTD